MSRSVSGSYSQNFIRSYASFSDQSFTCAEALRDHQARTKNRVHICGTWYILFRSPREFRLSDIQQWENLHKPRQLKKTRGGEALQLKVWKPYISPFPLMQTASSHSAPFKSLPSEYLSVATCETSISVCSIETSSMPTSVRFGWRRRESFAV